MNLRTEPSKSEPNEYNDPTRFYRYLNKSNIKQTVMVFVYEQHNLTACLPIFVHLMSSLYQYFLAASC